jgi:hypothetical protein
VRPGVWVPSEGQDSSQNLWKSVLVSLGPTIAITHQLSPVLDSLPSSLQPFDKRSLRASQYFGPDTSEGWAYFVPILNLLLQIFETV